MKEKFKRALRWLANRVPEVLLAFFLASLTPLLYLLGKVFLVHTRVLMKHPRQYFTFLKFNIWPAIAAVVCLAGTGVLIVLVLRFRHLIWAVARKMILEAINHRVVLVLLVFLLVVTPSLPFILQTEGNVKSQAQIVFTYALFTATILLSLLAIFTATASICGEVERQQVHVTDCKPLGRWQFILGKWLGIVVMCAALLFVMAGSVYGLVRYIARERDYSGLSEWEAAKKKAQREKLFDEVFVTRIARKLPKPDISAAVWKELDKLREMGELERLGGKEEYTKQELARRILLARHSILPRGARRWVIQGLQPGKEGSVFVRFKLYSGSHEHQYMVPGVWTIEKAQFSEKTKDGKQKVKLVPAFRKGGYWKTSSFQEFKVPASLVAPNGSLYLTYFNGLPRNTVQIAQENGLEVLQKAEGFFPNYYRSLIVIFFYIALLAALGLMAGSMFSFPVASLLVVFICLTGLIGPWMVGIIAEGKTFIGYLDAPSKLNTVLDHLLKLFLSGMLRVVPHFGKFNPLDDLVSGRLVSWSLVSTAGATLLFFKGALGMLIGIYFYTRRELARVIV